jgi:hypothetical protein
MKQKIQNFIFDTFLELPELPRDQNKHLGCHNFVF